MFYLIFLSYKAISERVIEKVLYEDKVIAFDYQLSILISWCQIMPDMYSSAVMHIVKYISLSFLEKLSLAPENRS